MTTSAVYDKLIFTIAVRSSGFPRTRYDILFALENWQASCQFNLLEMWMGVGKTGISWVQWDSHGNGNTITIQMGEIGYEKSVPAHLCCLLWTVEKQNLGLKIFGCCGNNGSLFLHGYRAKLLSERRRQKLIRSQREHEFDNSHAPTRPKPICDRVMNPTSVGFPSMTWSDHWWAP